MERTFSLEIMQKNGKLKKVVQDFVPSYKADEYFAKAAEFERLEKEGKPVPESEITAFNREFVAGLFDDESVTAEVLKNGLDTMDNEKLRSIIRYRVLCYDEEKDELLKKLERNQILAGSQQETSSEKQLES